MGIRLTTDEANGMAASLAQRDKRVAEAVTAGVVRENCPHCAAGLGVEALGALFVHRAPGAWQICPVGRTRARMGWWERIP